MLHTRCYTSDVTHYMLQSTFYTVHVTHVRKLFIILILNVKHLTYACEQNFKGENMLAFQDHKLGYATYKKYMV